MPSKKQYNLVNDDAYDSRIPLHSEEAFQHGISFHAKYVGTLDVPRPSSRVEIVAAMRRIRYEFKARSIKKKKVTITISVDGVKVALKKKKRKDPWFWDESRMLVMQHPIYRIFYVSHDSQDLKIFSYIARDGGSNAFKCNVFKSSKKSQAMRIVRTVGQAFEVCHKLSLAQSTTFTSSHEVIGEKQPALPECSKKDLCSMDDNSCDNQMDNTTNTSESTDNPAHCSKLDCLLPAMTDQSRKSSTECLGDALVSPLSGPLSVVTSRSSEGMSLTTYHQLHLLKEQLEQQTQQTQAALAQVQLLKDQLAAETTARLEAQSQNHQLFLHNKELLEHIKSLVQQISELEKNVQLFESKADSRVDTGSAPHSASTCSTSTLSTGPVHLPDFLQMELTRTGHLSRTSQEALVTDSWLLKPASSQNTGIQVPRVESPTAASQDSAHLPGMSMPGTPTHSNFLSNLDDLYRFQNVRDTSPQTRTRTPAATLQSAEESASCIFSFADTSAASPNTPVTTTASPPYLSPPPWMGRSDKAGSQETRGRFILLESQGTQRDVSPSLTISSYSTPETSSVQGNLFFRQFSLPPHNQLPSDTALLRTTTRDLARLNLSTKDSELHRTEESRLTSESDRSVQFIFKS